MINFFKERQMRSNTQKGFTLIELVVVIVILGILAATALPKFIDISGEAKSAAHLGVVGVFSFGLSVYYAARKANVSYPNTVAVTNCSAAGSLLQGGLPTGYTVGSATIAADSTVSCNVSNGTTTTTASVIGIN